jgi:prepilin-type N-terminal cleavage/methylation domain-containing protein
MPHERPSRSASGFTLVELLAVMAILGVLVLVYVSTTVDRVGPAVRGELNTIAGSLQDARSMARGTGQTVTLTPSGTSSTARLDYQAAVSGSGSNLVSSSLTITWGASGGSYDHSSNPSVARYCQIDLDGSSTAGAAALASLKTSLQSVKIDGASVFTSNVWTQSLFAPPSTFQFNNNGSSSLEGFIAVVGSKGGGFLDAGPVGIILVNASGNIFRYYRSSSTAPWVRL